MRNAAAPSVGGESSAPMPRGRENRAAHRGPIAGTTQQRPRDRPSITVVATPLPETVPSRKPASVTVRPGAGARARLPHDGERPVDEEGARARLLEHRAVDREQDDVGRRDVERHAEHSFRA